MNTFIKNSIIDLLGYEQWANQQMLHSVNKLTEEEYKKLIPIPFQHIHGLLSHIYYYQEKYFHKIVTPTTCNEVNIKLSRPMLSNKILKCSENWLAWAKKINTRSSTLETKYHDLSKLTLHNNYHRGQLQIALCFLGHQPESLDIFKYLDTIANEKV